MRNKPTIKIEIRKSERKGYNFDYLFTDTHNKTFIELEPKRYIRVLAKIGGQL